MNEDNPETPTGTLTTEIYQSPSGQKYQKTKDATGRIVRMQNLDQTNTPPQRSILNPKEELELHSIFNDAAKPQPTLKEKLTAAWSPPEYTPPPPKVAKVSETVPPPSSDFGDLEDSNSS